MFATQSAWYAKKPTGKGLALLFLAAFFIRAITFNYFIKDHEYYRQPDSNDYNMCALFITYTNSMTEPGTTKPIIWRTPGYPAFMTPFYKWKGAPSTNFSDLAAAQQAVIWAQIPLCSVIPLILLYLAFLLSGSWFLGWAIAGISVVHIGFVLATTYLLTDALASLFFYLFLLGLYRAWFRAGDYIGATKPSDKQAWYDSQEFSLFWAGLSLAVYTWMRPMGKFVGMFTLLLLFMAPGINLWDRLKKMGIFLVSFFVPLLPWYIRNYRLTGGWFFCPMSGEYLRVFCAPKLVRRVTGAGYQQCMVMLAQDLGRRIQLHAAAHPGEQILIHLIAGSVAWPWIKQYPFAFFCDWMEQAIKTSFDLYSYQLVAMARNCYMCDPLEEFLGEKLAAMLYEGPLPLWMRAICWLELLSVIALWVGLLAGLYQFVLKPLYRYFIQGTPLSNPTSVWLLALPMIGVVIIQTGGFGYARLRIPIEPLLLILSGIWYLQFTKVQGK